MNKEKENAAPNSAPTIQLQPNKPAPAGTSSSQQKAAPKGTGGLPQNQQNNPTQSPGGRRINKGPPDMNTKIVPFTEVEWKYIQKTFMSDQLKDLEQMVDIMSMWICRMQHDTPVIIGISELVLRALVLERKHQSNTGSSTSMDNADVALIYASVIIRFVNYVNEVCQPDGVKPISIAGALSKMDIPSWIVNIRHEATHGQMPPMNLMKEAIKFCRRWLWKKHWSRPFNEAIKETLPHEMVEQRREEKKSTTGHKMVNALNRFREWRKRYRSLDHFHSVEGKPQDKARIQIEQLLESDPDEFVHFFAVSCLSCPVINNINNDSGIDSGADLLTIPEDDEEEEEISILEGDVMSLTKYMDSISGLEQRYYRPVLELFNNSGCLQRLLLELTRLVTSDPTKLDFARRRHLAGWADLLLEAFLQTPESVSIQDWRIVLRHLVLSPQFFRDQQIIGVLDVLNDSISDRCRKRLVQLLNIRHLANGSESTVGPSTSTSVHSVLETSVHSVRSIADLQKRIMAEQQADCTFQRDPLTLEDAWSIAQPDELGPLGLTANQRADTLCLALDSDHLFI